MKRLKIIPSKYFDEYNKKQPITLLKYFNKIKNINSNLQNFDFYISNSAVYSSMIEGNHIDLDSYFKYSYSGMNNNGKSYNEIKDLISSYEFAKENNLNLDNFLKCHKKLSKTIIEETKYRGGVRDKNVFVFSNGEKIFTGAGKDIVKKEMDLFFEDIDTLLNRELTINQVFYYASMLHLILVQIHPFADGNGRSARLLEKWFLAKKLGLKAWFIQSERIYQKRIVSYYKKVNIGNDYDKIRYDYSIPFLLMLPMALKLK